MTSRYALVGPSGSRVPCSQWRSVLTLKPKRAANDCWVRPSLVRMASTPDRQTRSVRPRVV